MDRASQALARGVPTGVPSSYRAVADHSGVPYSTLYQRARGRQSIEAKAQGQQYLAPFEEKAVVDFVLHMAELGTPVQIKHLPSLAFTATRHRPEAERPANPPNKNWSKAFENRHPELKARKARALDWNRHEKNIYHKIEEWFEVIAKVLSEPDILHENIYNMDETGVMLSMLGSIKVLAGRKDLRDYRNIDFSPELLAILWYGRHRYTQNHNQCNHGHFSHNNGCRVALMFHLTITMLIKKLTVGRP